MEQTVSGPWPELVGRNVDEAVQTLNSLNLDLNVIKLKENSPTTRDYRTNRVRVFYNVETNLVVSAPHCG
jgi:hypothetical protein